MRNIFFNSKKAKEERLEKEKLEKELSEEKAYIEALVRDQRFQKYIIEKRFRKPIETLSDIMTTPQMDAVQLEKEVAARKSTVRALKDILNSILV